MTMLMVVGELRIVVVVLLLLVVVVIILMLNYITAGDIDAIAGGSDECIGGGGVDDSNCGGDGCQQLRTA